jgi:pyrroline-5-carboxylate reductase
MTASTHIDFQKVRLAFIGGGNMASAILGGLMRQGLAQSQVVVIEPFAETAAKTSNRIWR